MLYLINVLLIIFFILACFGLVYFYASKNTTWFTIFTTFLGWIMGFLIIALLPLDIYIVIKSHH